MCVCVYVIKYAVRARICVNVGFESFRLVIAANGIAHVDDAFILPLPLFAATERATRCGHAFDVVAAVVACAWEFQHLSTHTCARIVRLFK